MFLSISLVCTLNLSYLVHIYFVVLDVRMIHGEQLMERCAGRRAKHEYLRVLGRRGGKLSDPLLPQGSCGASLMQVGTEPGRKATL